MVGREREQAELSAALDDVDTGRGSAALLVGEAGMGKSTLADWLSAQADARGFHTGRGVCSAGLPPMWTWRTVLRTIAPEGSRLVGNSAADQSGDPSSAASDRGPLAAAVVAAVSEASLTAPVLVVIEDLQWADPVTVLIAAAIAAAVVTMRAMVVFTYRDDPAEDPAGRPLGLADLPTSVRRIHLAGLEPPDVGRVAGDILGSPLTADTAARLRARTGGNPFFVHEVARLAAAHGTESGMTIPHGVQEILRRRIARLSQRSAAVVAAAAITVEAGADMIDPDLVSAACGVPEPDLRTLLDEAVDARLLEVERLSTGYRFRHDLIREAVEWDLPGAERARLHRSVALSLEGRGDPPGSAGRLAHHWSRAGGDGADRRAATWWVRAAREAVAGFGFETAEACYARALEHPATDRIAVSIERGEVMLLLGDTTGAKDVLLEATRRAAAEGRVTDLAKGALALGGGVAGFEIPIWDDDQVDLLRGAERALTAALIAAGATFGPGENADADTDLGLSDDALRTTALLASVRARLSVVLAGSLEGAQRVALADDAVALARLSGDAAVESAALAALCDAMAGPDFVDDRIAAASRILGLATHEADTLLWQSTLLLARRLLVLAHLERGEVSIADRHVAAYRAVADRLGTPRYRWLPEIWRGMRALLDGDPATALEQADAAHRLGVLAGSWNAGLMAYTLRTAAHLDRGTPAECVEATEALLFQAGSSGMPEMYAATPALTLLLAGRPERARAVLDAWCAEDPSQRPKDAEWLECHWSLAEIAIRLKDRGAAETLYAELAPYQALWAVDGIGGAVFGTVAEQLGRLAAFLGRPAQAAAHLDAARGRYRRVGAAGPLRRLDRDRPPVPAPDPGTGVFRREGPVWAVEWQGRRGAVRDAKGMRDLAILLARPGRGVPAVELVEVSGGPAAAGTGGDLGPMIDERARTAYRARLADLAQDLAEAEADADLGRVERLRAERSMIAEELSAALGLGGRPRLAGDPAERARKAVTMRIRAAIRSISAVDEVLGRHLENAVSTGSVCSYHPEGPVRWET